jgi:sugar O-acyltransferase (sialic acid O-acetyltransferase NeuD family)
MTTPLLVFGAGGYARCVVDAIEAGGGRVEAIVDRAPALGATLLNLPIRAEADVLAARGPAAACVAVGDNALRRRIVERIRAARPEVVFVEVRHPRACVARSAAIGEGTVLLAGAVVNPMARIGAHASIYSNAVVEHDCVVEDYVTLAPAAALGGHVRLGAGVFIGLGAVVAHGGSVGANSVLGAGSVVLGDQPADSVLVGAPARVLRARAADEPYL